jgi:hypothetical protein
MKNSWGHGSRVFVPNVNLIWTKEQTHDFLMTIFFMFDLHKLSYFVHKI